MAFTRSILKTSVSHEPQTYNAGMFVHLRLHTEFSVVDSTCRIDDVVAAAAKDGQPALAQVQMQV